MATQVLIVHGQLPFAIKLKQALERNAGFEAHPFTSVDAAVEYLQEHVQDVALLDFAIAEVPGEQIVLQLLGAQPNLPLIATPRLSEAQMGALDILASMDSGFGARELINVINSYFAHHDRPTHLASGRPSKRRTPEPPDELPDDAEAEVAQIDEAPVNVGDTPPGSVEELVWAEEPPKPESAFDDVLNSIQPNVTEAAPRNPFTDLVNSMRSEDAPRPLLTRQQQFVEYILTSGVESIFTDEDDAPKPPTTTFERLAQEEPPPPTFEESGTVSDLVSGVHDRSFRNVLSILRGEEAPPDDEEDAAPELPRTEVPLKPLVQPGTPLIDLPNIPELQSQDSQPTPAKVILQRTLEQSLSGGGFSLEELLANIDAQLPQHRPKVQPLPSWVREEQQAQSDQFLVQEPDFLPEQLPPEPTPIEPSEDMYPYQTTQAARGQVIEQHPEALETEWLEGRVRVTGETIAFPETLPEEIPAEPTVVHRRDFDEALPPDMNITIVHELPVADESTSGWYDLPEQDFNTQFEMMAAFEVLGEAGATSGALYTEVPVEPGLEAPAAEAAAPAPQELQDPYIAQLALNLTQASLELTAEAILLALNKVMVAYAGHMPEDEIEELRATIADDWDAAPGEVRIRFITAQGSGKDYMLYSRRTEDDFTLSLVFAGTTPLRDIRRQGQRLIDALNTVPEAPAAKAPPRSEPIEALPRTPYACVWLLSDPHAHLDAAVSQAISAGLNIQMSEKQWVMQALQVHEDYVYVFADVPGEEPPYQIVRELKHRSAEIAHAQNPAYPTDGLWADGYLVVTPGRELDVEEIQQFINFERLG